MVVCDLLVAGIAYGNFDASLLAERIDRTHDQCHGLLATLAGAWLRHDTSSDGLDAARTYVRSRTFGLALHGTATRSHS